MPATAPWLSSGKPASAALPATSPTTGGPPPPPTPAPIAPPMMASHGPAPAPQVGTPPPGVTPPVAAPAAPPPAQVAPTGQRDVTIPDLIREESQKAGIPPELALAVAEQESDFNPTVTGPEIPGSQERAIGTFQLLPSTAKRLGVDPTDPQQNVAGGVKYLRELMDQHQGDLDKVLASYGGVKTNTTYVPQVRQKIDRYGLQEQTRSAQQPAALGSPAGGELMMASHKQPGEEAPGTAPPAPPETWGQWFGRQGEKIGAGFDLRTAEGRRNLAGAGGAMIGTTLGLPSAAAAGPIGPIAFGAAGASIAGGLEAGGEALYRYATGAEEPGLGTYSQEIQPGTPPPASLGEVARAGTAGGAEQFAYELGGHALAWPIGKATRMALGSKVGKYATEGLARERQAVTDKLAGVLDATKAFFQSTRTKAAQETRLNKAAVAQAVSDAEQLGKSQVTIGRQLKASGISDAERSAIEGEARAMRKGEHAVEAARAPYEQAIGAPPPTAAAGRKVEAAFKGPIQEARNIGGEAVDEAARTGPDVNIDALKAEAQRIVEQQIRPPAKAFPVRRPEAATTEANAAMDKAITEQTGLTADRIAAMRQAAPGSSEAKKLTELESALGAQPEFKELADAQAEAQKEILKHPAMGVLQKILNADNTVSFMDAHLLKKELNDAISGTRDAAVKKQVVAITQHLTGQLRDTLRKAGPEGLGHAPYEAATKAYEKLIPGYTEGLGKRLRKLWRSNPEAAVKQVHANNPTEAALYVELLTKRAAEGGGETEGRQALEAVQSAWVHRKIINGQGGLEKLGDRIDALPPEFRQAFLGDKKATGVLDRLKKISDTYNAAVATSKVDVAAAKAGGKAEVEAATQAGGEGVDALKQLAEQRTREIRQTGGEYVEAGIQAGESEKQRAMGRIQPAKEALVAGRAAQTAKEQALAASSLPGKQARTTMGTDIIRAAGLGPRAWGGAMSIARLMRGTTGRDLVRWAAYSPEGTKLLIDVLMSPGYGVGLADLVRSSGVLGSATDIAAGTPPPTPGVGTPPPKPAGKSAAR